MDFSFCQLRVSGNNLKTTSTELQKGQGGFIEWLRFFILSVYILVSIISMLYFIAPVVVYCPLKQQEMLHYSFTVSWLKSSSHFILFENDL